MFVIYQKNVGERISQRYFKKWDAAKNALTDELNDVLSDGWIISGRTDRMNTAKGFYEYCVEGRTDDGEYFSLALIESYFEDEPNE